MSSFVGYTTLEARKQREKILWSTRPKECCLMLRFLSSSRLFVHSDQSHKTQYAIKWDKEKLQPCQLANWRVMWYSLQVHLLGSSMAVTLSNSPVKLHCSGSTFLAKWWFPGAGRNRLTYARLYWSSLTWKILLHNFYSAICNWPKMRSTIRTEYRRCLREGMLDGQSGGDDDGLKCAAVGLYATWQLNQNNARE